MRRAQLQSQRRAQIWSTDLTLSLVIFLAASAIAYTIIINTLHADDYQDVSSEASVAAGLLAGDGYPQYWINSTVIRAGLVSDGHLSLRKAKELVVVSANLGSLRGALRLTDNSYIYFTDQNGSTIPVFSSCGVGSSSSIAAIVFASLPAAAVVGPPPTGTHSFSDLLSIPEYTSDTGYQNISQYDVLVFEGNVGSNVTTADQASLFLEAASKRGITVFIIGNPGFPLYGVTINSSPAANITIQGNTGADLGLVANETINTTGVLATVEQPTNPAVSNYVAVGITNGSKAAYATWLYNDARVWYLASTAGNRSGVANLTISLAQAVNTSIVVLRPPCSTFVPPPAKQVATYKRTIPYHDQLLTMNVVVWRTT